MNVNDDNIDDSKPSATDTISDTVAPSKSPAERNTMLSTKHHIGRNTREFAHALNHLSTEDLPSYAREHNSLLTFPEKVRQAGAKGVAPSLTRTLTPPNYHSFSSCC